MVVLAAACALEPTLACGRKWARVQRWFRGGMQLAPIQQFFQRVVQPAVISQLNAGVPPGVPALPDDLLGKNRGKK